MSHRNAPLTETGRLRLARCVVEDGWPVRRAAERFQVSHTTAARWAGRYRQSGAAGMADRSCRPHRSPGQLPLRTERRIIKLRVTRRLGPARIAWALHLNPSTVHQVLRRYHCPRLAHLDRATKEPVRRYERDRPGELIHVDVKKLGNIPDGGGHRIHDRGHGQRNRRATSRSGTRRWDTDTCTPRWTTTPAWPTPRSSLMSARTLPPRSWPGRTSGTPAWASPSNASSPTTAAATAPSPGPRPASSSASRPSAPGPTGPRPTGKSSATTGPSPTNGPTHAPTAPKPNAGRPCQDGFTPTTITADTPHSAAARPPAASPTCPDRTASVLSQSSSSVRLAASCPARTAPSK